MEIEIVDYAIAITAVLLLAYTLRSRHIKNKKNKEDHKAYVENQREIERERYEEIKLARTVNHAKLRGSIVAERAAKQRRIVTREQNENHEYLVDVLATSIDDGCQSPASTCSSSWSGGSSSSSSYSSSSDSGSSGYGSSSDSGSSSSSYDSGSSCSSD